MMEAMMEAMTHIVFKTSNHVEGTVFYCNLAKKHDGYKLEIYLGTVLLWKMDKFNWNDFFFFFLYFLVVHFLPFLLPSFCFAFCCFTSKFL